MTYLLNHPWLFGLLVAVFLAVMIEVGQQIGAVSRIHQETHRKEQTIAIRDGLFVLVSLLLGFTLALAVPRFTERRSRLVEEAVSIGATNLRTGLLPSPWRENARALLRKYADARADLDSAGVDEARRDARLEQFAIPLAVSCAGQRAGVPAGGCGVAATAHRLPALRCPGD